MSKNKLFLVTGATRSIGGRLAPALLKAGYRVRCLRRLLIPVPVLTARLSAHWVHWMIPVHANIIYPLLEGLRNKVIVRDQMIGKLTDRAEAQVVQAPARRSAVPA